MKKLPLLVLVVLVSLSTISCGLFSMISNMVNGEPVVEETVMEPEAEPEIQPEPVIVEPTEEVVVVEEEPVVDARVVLFQDDFSDPNSGWDRNSWDNGTTDYANGVYQIVVKAEQFDVWANPYRYFDGDVSVEVDATKVGGELDDNFGVQCRYTGAASAPSYYFFYISSDGYAVIGKMVEGSATFLSSDQLQPTDAIIQGYSTNHLQADCIGTTLHFYVNGQLVAMATDSDLRGGDVGLLGGTYDIPSSTIEFDNFIVYQP